MMGLRKPHNYDMFHVVISVKICCCMFSAVLKAQGVKNISF